MPGVLVAIPCHGMMPPRATMALLSLQEFDHEANRLIKGWRLKQMSSIHWARNALVRDFLETRDSRGDKLTHLLFVDSDMVPTPDGVLKLIECSTDIAAGIFTTRQLPPELVGRRMVDGELRQIPLEDWPKDEQELVDRMTMDVDATGMAFTLIRREVFEKLQDPWFSWDPIPDKAPWEYGEDISFCLKAREAGFDIKIRMDLMVGHIGDVCYDVRHVWNWGVPEEDGGDGAGDS